MPVNPKATATPATKHALAQNFMFHRWNDFTHEELLEYLENTPGGQAGCVGQVVQLIRSAKVHIYWEPK